MRLLGRGDARSPWIVAVLCVLALLGCTPPQGAAAPSGATPSPTPLPVQRVWESAAHGYRIHLPDGWSLKPPSGPNDAADVRFGQLKAGAAGSYQVFEGALVRNPREWYEAARTKYTAIAKSIPAVKELSFRPLAEVSFGGRHGNAYEFDTLLNNGSSVTTRIAFIGYDSEGRFDVHELIVTADTPVFEALRGDIEGMPPRVEFR